MQGSLFNQENAALQPMYFWYGQIVDDKTWKGNQPDKKWANPDEIPGWGARYRVRIFGRDTGDVPDEQLDMAEVMLPVTAGSGHVGAFQTVQLKAGTFVVGFYRDGIDREDPVILGCIGNNEQTKLANTVSLKPFQPFSTYAQEGVAYYNIPPGGSPSASGSTNPNEGANQQLQTSSADKEAAKDGKESSSIASKCDKAEASAMQKNIKKLIQDVENAKKQVKDWQNTVMKPINYKGEQMSLSDYIQMKISLAAKDIAGFFKNIIDQIRKFTTEKVNNTMKDTYYLLQPNERPEAKEKVEKASDLLSCLFNKIISNLLKMIGKALLAMLDKAINAAECLINNFIGGLLGKLLGLITSAISNILKPLEALIGGAFNIGLEILGFVQQLLGFFSCEEEADCSEIKEWSIWNGPAANTTINVDNLFNTVKTFASNAQQLVDPNNFDFDLDFSDIFQDSCNLGALQCGPPTVVFYGGGGQGAAGNAIISAAGDILGVDIIASGFGYKTPPFIYFEDACGKGSGAVGRASIGPVTHPTVGPTIGVTRVLIEQSGTGYLPAPDGDRGGDGRVWATRCQSIIQRANGTWEIPYDPGEIMEIRVGDTIQMAGQSPYVSKVNETLTAVECPPINQDINFITPSSTTAQYPVVLYMCDVEVSNPGVAYSITDKIIVSPSNGAVLEPVYGAFGSLEDVKIISSGIGFTEPPNVYIESETGYNAKILPVFCVNRVGDVPEADASAEADAVVASGEKIIQVIDCVGKV